MAEFSKISADNRIVQTNKTFLISRLGLQVLRGLLITVPESDTEEGNYVSILNTPVIDNIVFQEGSYLDLEGNEISYNGLRIDSVIIEVSQTKNIVKTAIQGRNSTVKEYVSDGDYTINIRGVINDVFSKERQKVYPLEYVQDFVNLCKAQRSLVITCEFLNEVFDINDIVIESYNLPQVEGVRNQQPFTITASSDVLIDLEELDL